MPSEIIRDAINQMMESGRSKGETVSMLVLAGAIICKRSGLTVDDFLEISRDVFQTTDVSDPLEKN